MPKDRSKIIARGGGILKIRELKENEGWYDVGYLGEVTVNFDADLAQVRDGSGIFVDEKVNTQTVTLTATLLQTTREEISKIIEAAEKYFDIFYSVKITDTLYQEIYIPLAKIRPRGNISYKAEPRNIPLEIVALMGKHTTAQTVTASGGNITVLPGQYIVFKEGTTSWGEITESAASVRSKFY